MVKPMPGNPLAPSLAESWTMSPDGLTYEFVLRKGAKFHNGEPVTAEDVKFSFERYRGTSAKAIKDRVAAIETPDPQQVRFKLKAPWPDFLTFYASATGAGWIVPKKYVEKVGDDGFKKAPVGAGPYKFVSFTPGVELTLEAFEQYWRKTPNVKRLVFRVIPDESTRLAALKRGEVDIVYSIRGELAEELQRTKGLTLKPAVIQRTVLDLLPRPVGPEVAMARPARAAGRQPGHRPQDHQPGTDARPLQAHRQHHPGQLRILLAAAGARLRPGQGQEAAGRGRPPQRLRRRRLLLRCLLLQPRRGGDQQPAGRGHPRQAAAARAGCLLQGLLGEEASRTSSRGRAAPSATPPRGSRPSSSRAAPMSTATIPTSTSCSSSRPPSSTARSARRSCTRSSSSCTSARSTRRSGSWPSSTAPGPASGESGLGLIAGHAYSAPYEDVTLKAK